MNNKRVVIVIKIIILFLCIILANQIILFCTYEKNEFAGTMEQIYDMEDNIDILLLGSSHTDVSFDEKLLSDLWNKNVVNAGTPVQKPDVSYYLLKETVKKNQVEKVYLDMYYYMYHDEPKERTNAQLEFVYLVSDEMKWSSDKVKFLLDACPTESWINAFLKGSRHAANIMNLDKFESIVKGREENSIEISKNNEQISKSEYSICIRTQEDYQLEQDNISNYSYKYLEKIVKLCEQENIELILVATPMTDYQLSIIGNYDDYISNVYEFINKVGINYRDYNLCNPQILNLDEWSFSDIHHLNAKGTEIFTELFAQLENDKNKYEQYFYKTYKEKLEEMEPDCFGINVFYSEEGFWEIIPVCNQDMNLIYEVSNQEETINLFGEKSNKFKAKEGEHIIKVMSNNKLGVNKLYKVFLESND